MARRSRRLPANPGGVAGANPGGVAAPRRAPVVAARTEPRDAALAFAINVEAVLWVALIGFALSLRFVNLNELPFTVSESARGLNAWLVSHGSTPEGWSGDAASALTSHLFRIFGDSETFARVLPAIFGSALVVSFWFGRRYFGRGGVLLAASFICFSPLAVNSSRTAFSFAFGGLLSMVMVLSLLAYLEKPRPWPGVIFSLAFGLALGSDPIAVSTAIALVAFVALEATWRRGGPVESAVSSFRQTAAHWQPAAIALALTLVLALVQFGTDIDRLSLPGVRQWVAMFDLPRESLPWHYHLDLLAGYELPLLISGGAGYLLFLYRWLRGSAQLSLVQRLLVAWATVAILVVAFATRRDADQAVLLLLPFSLIAADVIEETASRVDWGLLKRWWPAGALALCLLAYALLRASRWAHDASKVGTEERITLVLALALAGASLATVMFLRGRNGLAVVLPVGAVLALPFLLHSCISLGFGDGAEFAVPLRFTQRDELFADTVAREADQRGARVAIRHPLRDALSWQLRDSLTLAEPPPSGSLLVGPAGDEPPAGFAPLGGTWLLAEGWVPRDLDLLGAWRWLAEREPYGNLSTVETQILVPAQ